MTIKKNQSSTKQKKEKISDIELNEKLYPKDKNQILSEAKPEGSYSSDKDKLDSRTIFSRTKSLESQMGKRWYEYENGKLGIILSKNI